MILFCLAIQHSRSLIQVSCAFICSCIFLQLIVASLTFFFILLMSFLFISISRMRKCIFFSIYSSNSRNIWLWAELKEILQETIIIFSITDSESDATKNEEKLAWNQEERRFERSNEETELTRLNSDKEETELTEMSIKSLLNALKSIN